MPSVIEIQYNPYLPQLSILINGMQPPDFSRLIQYSDEDIWEWAYEIFNTIYAEIRDEFVVKFTGTPLDANVLRVAAKKNEHCIGFNAVDFIVSESIQHRMGKLNKLIKKADITVYKKTIIDAVFMVPITFHEHLEDITSLDINNLFCTVRVQTISSKASYVDTDNSVLFILTDSIENGDTYISRYNLSKPAFVIIVGADNTAFSRIDERGWFISTKSEDIFDIIFTCFMQMPLLIAFRRCLCSIKSGNKIKKDLQRISCIEPIVSVSLDSSIEVGKSAKIQIALDPPVGNKPQLIYKIRNQNMASCDGINVYGQQEGACVLEVYRSGSKKPFFTKEIQIYKRNRITKLLLSDNSLIVGIHDCKVIGCDYFPVNADNTDTIQWRSSDEKVIQVDSKGKIVAIASGTCRIICTAENVSSQCMCTVKPYLENIKVDNENIQDDKMILEPLQEMKLSLELIPQDCIDGQVTIESSNSDVVNVVNQILYAKNKGEATITISNSTGRISRSFNAIVTKKHAKKKQGFFSMLFK